MDNLNKNLDSFFCSRDKQLTKINEAVDYLSRSTRENLAILNIDKQNNSISMVSESDNLINCDFEFVNGEVRLSKFSTTEVSEVLSDEYMDKYTSNKVSSFVDSLRENKYEAASTSFDDLLSAFTNRSQVNEYRSQVSKAQDSLDKNIFDSESDKFKQVNELKENIKKEIQDIEEFDMDVVNALKLNNAISKAFNLPKQDITLLTELVVPQDSKSDLYEMICENELVRKEIINAKGNLAGAWHNNSMISELASCIYEDESVIGEKLVNVVEEIPYFALASKKEIQEVLTSTYEVINPGTVSTKDIRLFTSKIFETKKPIKEVIVEMLNIKYGININNLKMIPSFKTLAESQSSLFTLLSEHLEKGGICQKTLKEFGSHLRNKSGVGILDVSDFIMELFDEVEFEDPELNNFMKPVNLQEAIKDLLKKKGKEDEDESKERSNDDEDDAVDTKKLKAVAKKAKDIASKLKGEKPEDDGEDDGDDSEADKDLDGDGDVDDVDKKVSDEKKGLKKSKKEKQAKDEDKKDIKEAAIAPTEADAPVEAGAPEEAAAGAEVEGEPAEDGGNPEAPGLSDEEVTDLVADLETIFQDIDFSKGQEMSQEETDEEEEALAVEEQEDELAQAQQDLASAQEKVDSMMSNPEGEEVPPEQV